MIERVWSGGQGGVDLIALRAAKAAGLATGGWACRGWLVEARDGRGNVAAPWLGADFGLRECEAPGYAARRLANARDSDGTLLFYTAMTPGTRGLLGDIKRLRTRPLCVVYGRAGPLVGGATNVAWDRPDLAAEWVVRKGIRTLNVAGPRAASLTGRAAELVELFLGRVFAALGHPAAQD